MGNKNTKNFVPSTFAIEIPKKISLVLVSPNQNLVVVGYGNKTISIYDTETLQLKLETDATYLHGP
jgi:hypothetical protein